MLLRRSAAAAVGVALLTCTASQAAPASVTKITDSAGDANFLSTLGTPTTAGFNGVPGPEDQALPGNAGNQGYVDLLSGQIARTKTTAKVVKVVKVKKKTVKTVTTVTTYTGYTISVTLAAAPTAPTGTIAEYKIKFVITNVCGKSGTMSVSYFAGLNGAGANPPATIYCGSGVAKTAQLPPATVSGSTVTWNVPAAALPKDMRASQPSGHLDAYTRVLAVVGDRRYALGSPVVRGGEPFVADIMVGKPELKFT